MAWTFRPSVWFSQTQTSPPGLSLCLCFMTLVRAVRRTARLQLEQTNESFQQHTLHARCPVVHYGAFVPELVGSQLRASNQIVHVHALDRDVVSYVRPPNPCVCHKVARQVVKTNR